MMVVIVMIITILTILIILITIIVDLPFKLLRSNGDACCTFCTPTESNSNQILSIQVGPIIENCFELFV